MRIGRVFIGSIIAAMGVVSPAPAAEPVGRSVSCWSVAPVGTSCSAGSMTRASTEAWASWIADSAGFHGKITLRVGTYSLSCSYLADPVAGPVTSGLDACRSSSGGIPIGTRSVNGYADPPLVVNGPTPAPAGAWSVGVDVGGSASEVGIYAGNFGGLEQATCHVTACFSYPALHVGSAATVRVHDASGLPVAMTLRVNRASGTAIETISFCGAVTLVIPQGAWTADVTAGTSSPMCGGNTATSGVATILYA